MLRVVSFWHQPEEYPHFLSSLILPSRRPPVKSLWMKNEHLAQSHIQCGHLFSPDSLCQGSLELRSGSSFSWKPAISRKSICSWTMSANRRIADSGGSHLFGSFVVCPVMETELFLPIVKALTWSKLKVSGSNYFRQYKSFMQPTKQSLLIVMVSLSNISNEFIILFYT